MSRILVVNREPGEAEAMASRLRLQGHNVACANANGSALTAIDRVQPDLIVLDVPNPVAAAINYSRRVRARARITTPILAVVPAGEEIDLADLPADDCVIKPLRYRELIARVHALLTRAGRAARTYADIIVARGIRISRRTRSVETARGKVRLTAREFDLLYFLATHPGQVFSRDQLMVNVWDMALAGDTRTVTSHIRRLRCKLEVDSSRPQHLQTIWGVGYTWII